MGSSLLTLAFDNVALLESAISSSAILAQGSSLSALGNQFSLIAQVALGLGFVVFVHELGHFLAAKTFGVRCDKFYVGFDVPISIGPIRLPRTLGKFQWGETEYGIGIIPLGGYVKMLGQDDDPRKAEEEAAKLRLGEGEEAPLDPRSYPAKPVWQRMIIISAGVVMNLIFAVILAGIAYGFGVNYTPTVAGSTYAGGPAWQVGIMPGDQVLRVGSMTEETDKLRYDDFATEVVSHGFEFKSKPMPFVIERDGQRSDLSVTPTPRYHQDGFYFVGMSPPTTPKIADPPFATDSFIASRKVDLREGDVIVAVNGEELPVDKRFNAVVGSELTSRLQANWEDPVTVRVEREPENKGESVQTLELELPAVPVKTLGIGFKIGPVTAIQDDSFAEAAGVQVGDVITHLNGQPVEDALKFPALVAQLAGQEIELTVQRGNSDDSDDPQADSDASSDSVTLIVQNAEQARFDPVAPRSGELTLGGVGIAFNVSPVVSSLSENATAAGLQVGDELIQIHWQVDGKRQKELSKQFRDISFKPLVIEEAFNVPCLYDLLQAIPEGETISCRVERNGKVQEAAELTVQYADEWYWHQRGIGLSQLMDVYKADGFASAVQLGFWETSRRFTGVLNFLKLLVTGRIGANGLGGPGRIAYVAANEASYGPARLMIFLTMLSANLAILNFLPIPALDGGHMVFLTFEAIRGKPVNEALQVRLTMLGVLSLLSLMAFVIVKDIMWFAN